MSSNKTNINKIFSDRCPNIVVKMVRLRSSDIKQSKTKMNTIEEASNSRNKAPLARKTVKEDNESNSEKPARRSSRLSAVKPAQTEKIPKVGNKNVNKVDNKKELKSLESTSSNKEIKTKNIKENKNSDKNVNVRRSTRISLVLADKSENNLETPTKSTKKDAILTKNIKSPSLVVNIENKALKNTLSNNESLLSVNDEKIKARRSDQNLSISKSDSSKTDKNTEIDNKTVKKSAEKKTKNSLNKPKNRDIDKNNPPTNSNQLNQKKQLIDDEIQNKTVNDNKEVNKQPVGRPRKSLDSSLSPNRKQTKSDPVKNTEITEKSQENLETTPKIDNNSIDNSKITEKNELEPKISKRLRQQKNINYRESSLSKSQNQPIKSPEQVPKNLDPKIPVYKQKVDEIETDLNYPTDKKDLYEFEVNESDSDEINARNKEKKTNKLNKKRNNNRTVKKIPKSKRVVKKRLVKPVQEKYEDKVQRIVKDVMEKVNLRKSLNESNTSLIENENVENENIENKTQQNDCSPKNQESELNSSNNIPNTENDLNSTNKNDSPQINILSDILVNENDHSSSDQSKSSETPWRFQCEAISRHPYFLRLKKSALPTLDQEMVLDHTVVERHPKFNTESTIANDQPASPIQKSILEYVTVHKSTDKFQDNDVDNTCSFFDTHTLSPLKVRNENVVVTPLKVTKRKLMIENDKDKMSTPISKKRKISKIMSPNLSIIQQLDDAIDEIESSNEDKENSQKENENTLFGFDSSNEENLPIKDNRDTLSRPLRFSLPMKKYVAKEAIEKRPLNVDSSSDSGGEEEKNENEEDAGEGTSTDAPALFEDLIDNRKGTKRKQTVDALKPDQAAKKRKKDAMTKTEEEAFNKWAESFNAMCEEVEKFPLEIE